MTMANAVQYNGFHAQSAPVDGSFIGKLWMKVKQYRLYRETIAELNRLSNHELVGLGLSRSGIKSAAYAAVYGA